jgi:DNA-directed RNA polymerase specialized sigma24 family protein
MEIVMNTSNHRQSYSLYPHKTDAQIQAEFADLVVRACKGDRRAVGAIYIAFGPVLLREARSVMGPFKQDAEDVVQDFFDAVLAGRAVYEPTGGHATHWMRGLIRAIARTYCKDREREWDLESEP